MTKQNQSGSTPVIVIIVLVVALLGTLGYAVWQNFLQPKLNTETSQTNGSSDSPADTVKNAEYVILTDWNIKLQLPDELDANNLKYEKTHIAEAPEHYSLTTTKIIAQGGECAGGYPFGDIVSLERSDDKKAATDNAAAYGGELINSSAIKGYFYYYETSIATTTPVPACAVTSIANSERSLLVQLVKSLVEV